MNAGAWDARPSTAVRADVILWGPCAGLLSGLRCPCRSPIALNHPARPAAAVLRFVAAGGTIAGTKPMHGSGVADWVNLRDDCCRRPSAG